jgi:hypothetical protein
MKTKDIEIGGIYQCQRGPQHNAERVKVLAVQVDRTVFNVANFSRVLKDGVSVQYMDRKKRHAQDDIVPPSRITQPWKAFLKQRRMRTKSRREWEDKVLMRYHKRTRLLLWLEKHTGVKPVRYHDEDRPEDVNLTLDELDAIVAKFGG